MAVITIVGAGMMGSALAFPASKNGHEVHLCGTHLDDQIIDVSKLTGRRPRFEADFPKTVKLYHFSELTDALKGADLVICGVNSFGVDWFYENVLKILPATTPVLSVTKGLYAYEDGTMVSFPAYWEKLLGDKKMNICAIGGPCISFELALYEHTIVTYCGKDRKTLEFCRKLMQTDTYHVRLSDDVMAIETAVALKNAYTLGVAFAVGSGEVKHDDGKLRYNEQAALFYQGTKEMYRMIEMLAGTGYNVDTAAGDMYVTVFGGRTRLLGRLLGRGLPLEEAVKRLSGETLESVAIIGRVSKALKTLAKAGKVDLDQFPMMMYMNEVLEKGIKPAPWDKFTA